MIIRTFHPVGQGAFYSERHDGFNIVYDCGTEWKNRNNPKYKNVVTQSFSEEDTIDILFISHFDCDHISLIEKLIDSVKEIKNVVLPLLHEVEINLLINFYRGLDLNLGINVERIIRNPEELFGESTRIFYVLPSAVSEERDDNIQEILQESIILETIYLDEQYSSKYIKSGGKIFSYSDSDWVFIPFNYEYKRRHKQLIDKLTEEGIDPNVLMNNPAEALNDVIHNSKKIKDIYSSLEGSINQNSMFLYSGPAQYNDGYFFFDRFSSFRYHCFDCYLRYGYRHRFCANNVQVACIYSGDGDYNVVDISAIYKSYWKNVGTIQIPHHGSAKSFKINNFKKGNYCCPISFGKDNSYGHPSNKVVEEILSEGSIPIFVTDDSDSQYTEMIEHQK